MNAMKQRIAGMILSMVLLLAAPYLSFGQYFQGLYDYDATQDWGVSIFPQPHGDYFVIGTSFNPADAHWSLINMQISADGSTILGKHVVQSDSASFYSGNSGQVQTLPGGYITPLTVQWPNPVTKYLHSAAGLIKYNGAGDTVFFKTYTDTSLHFDNMIACATMPDGGYIGGGGHGLNIPSYYPGYIVRTDSVGDTLWTHTYQKDTTQWVIVNNIIPLADGRIVVAAASIYQIIVSHGLSYDHYTPWFMVLDSMGNILKDTLYGSQYMLGNTLSGELYKDMNGGYIHIGNYNNLYTSDPSDIQNFPSYIAHLDTNFRITWITPFNYTTDFGHRQGIGVRQLQDSSYMIFGNAQSYFKPGDLAWAAKVDRNGSVVWCKEYFSDSAHNAYFMDMKEKPDGSIVFTGQTFNDTLPSWRQGQDVWLFGVDSNGCDNPFCAPAAVKNVPNVVKNVELYPNPTTGSFTIEHGEGSRLGMFNLLGQQVFSAAVISDKEVFNVGHLASGVYVVRIMEQDGMIKTVRLVKE